MTNLSCSEDEDIVRWLQDTPGLCQVILVVLDIERVVGKALRQNIIGVVPRTVESNTIAHLNRLAPQIENCSLDRSKIARTEQFRNGIAVRCELEYFGHAGTNSPDLFQKIWYARDNVYKRLAEVDSLVTYCQTPSRAATCWSRLQLTLLLTLTPHGTLMVDFSVPIGNRT